MAEKEDFRASASPNENSPAVADVGEGGRVVGASLGACTAIPPTRLVAKVVVEAAACESLRVHK